MPNFLISTRDWRLRFSRGLRLPTGPIDLEMGDVADGQYLRRTGTTVVGGSPGGGGSPPTGTGFRHITAGTEDAAAKLVQNVDVHTSAAIAESKLALNYATHTNANDPATGEKAALAGTSGTPGAGNKYVTNSDARLSGGAGVVPIGGIIMWSGTIATIPATWALCDGTANSPGPDLRDRFVVGATSDSGGAAKTNLTGTLTQSGGAVTHHHADHTRTTDVALSAHALTTNVALSAHSLTTSVALSAHALTTNVALSAHSLSTNVAIANHTTANSAASGTTRSIATVVSHTITQPAVAAHTITQPVVGDHAITQPVVGDHAITQPVVGAHTITQPVIDAHDTLSAPQPYYALAFIQRMT